MIPFQSLDIWGWSTLSAWKQKTQIHKMVFDGFFIFACFRLLNNAESSEKTTLLYWALGEMCRFWQVNWRHAEEVHMFSGDSNLQARSFHT